MYGLACPFSAIKEPAVPWCQPAQGDQSLSQDKHWKDRACGDIAEAPVVDCGVWQDSHRPKACTMRLGLEALLPLLLITLLSVRRSFQLLHSGQGSQDEDRLVQFLFEDQGYNPLIRPVKNQSDHVNVQFGMALVQLISVDEKNQIMKSNVWLRMLWQDYQLRWDPPEYGGIDSIRILSHKVWKPDIVLFNNADGKYEVSYKPNVVIYSDGNVLWIPPAIYKSSCTIDVEYFPFDEQECDMKFGSWTFNGDQVTLSYYENLRRVDLSDYVYSGTWDIMKCPGEVETTWDEKELLNTTMITYKLQIRRKTLFYTVNLIIPCVLISFLSVSVFYLPADAGEKMTMCISILLALVVFLLLVSKILPPTSITIPLIAKYLLFTFIMNIFTILITVIIINWNFRTPRTHRMARWVRVVFLNYLPRILFMKRPNHSDRWSEKNYSRMNVVSNREPQSVPNQSGATPDIRAYSQMNARQQDLLELSEMHHPNCRMNRKPPNDTSNRTDMDGGPESNFQMTPETHKAIEAVRFIAAHLKNEDDYAEILEDWRYIAMVIDRFQLYVFLAVTIGGTVGILINAPHIFDFVDQQKVLESINENNNS